MQRVVHLSSAAAYGAGPESEGPLAEDMPCHPHTLYGITKLAGERTALRLAQLAGLDLVAARLGSCFGPWEHATGLRDTLSPQYQILSAVHRGEAVVLDADAVRDWLYVRDAAASVLALLGATGLQHRLFNIGSGLSYPLSAWCEALQPRTAWTVGTSANVQSWSGRPPMSTERLAAATGYQARFDARASAADWQGFLAAAGQSTLQARQELAA